MSVARVSPGHGRLLLPRCRGALWGLSLLCATAASTPWDVMAAASDAISAAATPSTEAAVDAPSGVQSVAADAAALDRPLRGISVQGHIGGGYMALGRKIAAQAAFPQLQGASEMLGAGPAGDVTLGIDILSFLGLQVTGGVTFAGGRRPDYAHSLVQSYVAIGPRFTLPVDARWAVNLAPSFAYFHQDDGIEAAANGAGIVATAGVEYWAHVRHFSVGADLNVQVPLAPTRLFVGILPHVRYTF